MEDFCVIQSFRLLRHWLDKEVVILKALFHKVKVLIVAITLVLSVGVGTSQAVLPVLAVPLLVSVGVHVVAGVIVLVTSLRSGGATSVNRSTGTIARGAKVDWVDLTMSPPAAKSKDIVAKIPITDIQNKLLTDPAAPAKYPKLNDALLNGTGSYPPLIPTTPAGTKISSTQRTIGNVSVSAVWSGDTVAIDQFNSLPARPGIVRFIVANPPNQTYLCAVAVESTTPDSKTPKTIADAADTLDPQRDNSVETDFRGEIDDFITSNPNIVHFADTPDVNQADSAPAYVPNIPTAAQVQAAIAADVAKSAADAAKAAADAAKAAAAARTSSSQSRYDSAITKAAAANAAAANAPGDSGLAAAAAAANAEAAAAGSSLSDAQSSEAKAGADAAKADADAAKAAADAAAVAQAAASLAHAPSSAYGDATQKTDFSARFNQFLDDMKSTSFFTIPSKIAGNIPGGGDPVINFDGGKLGRHTFDFSTLSLVFSVLSKVFLILASVSAIKIVTLKGGSE